MRKNTRTSPLSWPPPGGRKSRWPRRKRSGCPISLRSPSAPPSSKASSRIPSAKRKKKKRSKRLRPPRKSASGKVLLNVAHIQITDHLTLGVLKHMIATEKFQPRYFELQTQCMPGWNPVQKALENGDVNAAFILAPIAMDLFGADAPIKLTLFAHKNGSICVRNKKGMRQAESLRGLLQRKDLLYPPHAVHPSHACEHVFPRIGAESRHGEQRGNRRVVRGGSSDQNARVSCQKPGSLRFYGRGAFGDQGHFGRKRLLDVSVRRALAIPSVLRRRYEGRFHSGPRGRGVRVHLHAGPSGPIHRGKTGDRRRDRRRVPRPQQDHRPEYSRFEKRAA